MSKMFYRTRLLFAITISVVLHFVLALAVSSLSSPANSKDSAAGRGVLEVVVRSRGALSGGSPEKSGATSQKSKQDLRRRAFREPFRSRPEFASSGDDGKTKPLPSDFDRDDLEFLDVHEVYSGPGGTDRYSGGAVSDTTRSSRTSRLPGKIAAEPGSGLPSASADETSVSAVGDPYRRRVVNKINRELDYPDEARRLGVEGNVQVEFYIDTGGRLRGKRVVSDYKMLSEAALEALGRAEPFPSPPAQLYSAQGLLKLSHRIKFRLR